MRRLADANVYVLHFDYKHADAYKPSYELFGSITSLVNYLLKIDVTHLDAKQLRKQVMKAVNNCVALELKFRELPIREFFISMKKLKVETRIHS